MQVTSLSPLRVGSVLWQQRPAAWVVSVFCKATFSLAPGESQLAAEQEYPNEDDNYWDDDPARSVYSPSDLVPFKPRVDITLVGHAFAPQGEPVRSLTARMVVGDLDKSIEVVQDRWFTESGAIEEGARFTRMPLRYERAAGGPETWNPVGVRADARGDAYGQLAIPNLQARGAVIGARGHFLEPVGFGPIPPAWPSRAGHLGGRSTDGNADFWQRVPLPADLDAAYFNAAPADQQTALIRDNERLVLEHLHPAHPQLVTSLPGLHPRAFVDTLGKVKGLSMVADSLWIDTDRALCTLTWRGRISLQAPSQPGRVLIALEARGETITWADVERMAAGNQASRRPPPAEPPPRRRGDPTLPAGTRPVMPGPRATPPPSRPPPPPLPGVAAAPAILRAPIAPAVAILTATPAIQRIAYPEDEMEPLSMQTQAIRRAVVEAPLPFQPAQPGVDVALAAAAAAAAAARAVGPPAAKPGIPVAPGASIEDMGTYTDPGAPADELPAWLARGAGSADAPPASARPGAIAGSHLVDVEGEIATAHFSPPPLPESPWAGGVGRSLDALGLSPSSAPLATTVDPSRSAMAASNAAAGSSSWSPPSEPPRAAAETAEAAPRSIASSKGVVELLWFNPKALPRIRTWWAELLAELSFEAIDAKHELPTDKPEEARDRPDVFNVISGVAPIDGAGVAHAISDGVAERQRFTPPMVVVAGDLRFPFDDIETLKATIAVVTPLIGSDKKLRESVDMASELLKSPYLQGGVVDRITRELKEQLAQSSRNLTHGDLDLHTERVLLEQRHYQRRKLFGATSIRALLQAGSPDQLIPTYLPEELSETLPMVTSMRVRLVAEAHFQQDQYESHPHALRVVALARVVAFDAYRWSRR